MRGCVDAQTRCASQQRTSGHVEISKSRWVGKRATNGAGLVGSTSRLEQDFADCVGASICRYAMTCSSGLRTTSISLRVDGLEPQSTWLRLSLIVSPLISCLSTSGGCIEAPIWSATQLLNLCHVGGQRVGCSVASVAALLGVASLQSVVEWSARVNQRTEIERNSAVALG